MILAALCLVASIYDGDTIRCQDGTRIRLAGIDAPEISCQHRRPCRTEGSIESRDNLRRLAGSRVRYKVVDANRCKPGFQATDPFGRVVARVWANGVDLGRAQREGGFAVKWRCR